MKPTRRKPARKAPPPGPLAPDLLARFERLLGRWPPHLEPLRPERIKSRPYRSHIPPEIIEARRDCLTLALEHLASHGPDPEAVYNVLAEYLLEAEKAVIARLRLRADANIQDNVAAWVKETKELGMGFVLDLLHREVLVLEQIRAGKKSKPGRPHPPTVRAREALKRLGVKSQVIDHLLRAIGFLPLKEN